MDDPNRPVRLAPVTCSKQPRSTNGRSTPGWLRMPRLRSGWESTPTRPADFNFAEQTIQG